MPPSRNSMQIDFERLEPSDKLEILVLDENAEIGKFEMQLQDQFGKQLSGDFDKWFKLYVHESPTRVKYQSPDKSPNTSFTRLYEDDPGMDLPQRIGRIRITMRLGPPLPPTPKVQEISLDPPETIKRPTQPVKASAGNSPTPTKEPKTPISTNLKEPSPIEVSGYVSPSNRPTESPLSRPPGIPSNRPTE